MPKPNRDDEAEGKESSVKVVIFPLTSCGCSSCMKERQQLTRLDEGGEEKGNEPRR